MQGVYMFNFYRKYTPFPELLQSIVRYCTKL